VQRSNPSQGNIEKDCQDGDGKSGLGNNDRPECLPQMQGVHEHGVMDRAVHWNEACDCCIKIRPRVGVHERKSVEKRRGQQNDKGWAVCREEPCQGRCGRSQVASGSEPFDYSLGYEFRRFNFTLPSKRSYERRRCHAEGSPYPAPFVIQKLTPKNGWMSPYSA